LSRVAVEAAEQGDEVAIGILRAAAEKTGQNRSGRD
jgi:N-acetylglucosamine kinase-like BadF-type ATPase